MIRKWKWALGLAVVLAVMSLLLYRSGIENPFIFDDIAKIQDNPDLHLKEFDIGNFIHDYSENKSQLHNDPSRPLTFLSYWLLWQLGDGSPAPFHLVAIALHALCAFLLGLLTLTITQMATGKENALSALLASLFYLGLPVLAGTVIYVYAFSDVLGAVFSLGAMVLYPLSSKIRWWHWILIPVLYAAAVFSKQSALVLPALLVTMDFFASGWRKVKERWRIHTGMFLLAAVYIIWRFAYFGRIGDLEAYETYQVSIYAPLQGIMIWKYLLWIFLPVHLAIDHALTPAMFEYWQCWLSWGTLAAVSVSALIWGRKNSLAQVLSIGWFVFLFGLLPTSSLFPTTDLLVDRRVYFPAAGILLAVGFLVARILERWRQQKSRLVVATAVLIGILAFNAVFTIQRVKVYGNEELLWREVIALFPRNERPRTNLATYYLKKENFEMAEKELNELLAMYPNYFEALTDQSALYQHPRNPKRNLAKALEYNDLALNQEPDDLTALMNRGILMLELQKPAEAVSFFEKIISLNPHLIRARLELADSFLQIGEKEKAHAQAQKVLELDPDNLRALLILRQ